ncbi:MAG: NAD-dependent epimerase/dehydratase family protein [Nocardioides sp.]
MRMLLFGGNVFLGKAIAEASLARGHRVTCLTRGRSGGLPAAAHHVAHDRRDPLPNAILTDEFDAVIDVGRRPSHVRTAVAELPGPHWTFISTISVYANEPGPRTLLDPVFDDPEGDAPPEAYGGMKVACERLVTEHTRGPAIVRPGLIAGPGDPTGRYTYWPNRLAASDDGRPVLAPGEPDSPAQLIDVRDLAAWIVRLSEKKQHGIWDGVGPTRTWGSLLADTAVGVGVGVGVDPAYAWRSHEHLAAAGVTPWMGPRALPMWLPLPEYLGMVTVDPAPARAAGLATRPLAETAGDTLAWARSDPTAVVDGIGRARESELLR